VAALPRVFKGGGNMWRWWCLAGSKKLCGRRKRFRKFQVSKESKYARLLYCVDSELAGLADGGFELGTGRVLLKQIQREIKFKISSFKFQRRGSMLNYFVV